MTQPADQWGQTPPGFPPHPYGHGYSYPVAAQPPSNGLGVAGFVCGLLSLVLFWIPGGGLVLGILGVTMGGMGMSHGSRTGAGSGLAIAGLVCGIVGSLVGVLYVIGIANS